MGKKAEILSQKQLARENKELKTRLEQAEKALNAIQNGEGDNLIESGKQLNLTAFVEKPYQVILEEMNEGALTVCSSGTILYSNPKFAELVKEPLEQIIGSSIQHFFDNDEMDKFRELLKNGIKKKCTDTFSFKIKNKKRKFHFQLSSNPLPPPEFGNICIIVTDRTELIEKEKTLEKLKNSLERQIQERTEELSRIVVNEKESRLAILNMMEDVVDAKNSLSESKERLNEAQQLGKIGSWESDIETGETSWSEQAYRLYERDPKLGPLTPDEITQYYSAEQREKINKYTQMAIEKAESFEYDIEGHLPSGKNISFSATIRPITNKNGKVIRLQGTLQDISKRIQAEEEREQLQAQLHQAQKMEIVGRLAGGVAHDFNNMLSVIIGNTELALSQLDPGNALYDELLEIQKAAERSTDVTRQLLAFARKQTIKPKVLDLNKAVDGMIKMLHRLIGENIHLSWLPGKNLKSIKIDPSQIDQILSNLCINARDAISDVGRLTIETNMEILDEADCAEHADYIPGEYVKLSISDDGKGMDKKTLANIFEPFFTTKGVGEGTGLGLSTVYGIVKQNNGFIDVYSEMNHGTQFTIYLPSYIDKKEQLEKSAHSKEIDIKGEETILLVEDQPSILNIIAKMLEQKGYTVLSASTPGEAIQIAELHLGHIDLLITDVVMPEMNGRELAKNLLAIYPDMKRLFMSGYTADVIANRGLLYPGIHFIQKPFSQKDLSEKVREVLGKAQDMRQGW